MEDYIKQLLMQELQGQGGDSDEGSNPTITPESKAGVGIASLINAIVGAKAMKGSGNAGLGALYGGAATYGEGMGNLQKAAAQAQANRSKEERIKSLIKNQIFKQNFDTVKYLEDRKLKDAKAKKDALAAQNYGILLDPSNFTGMTPDEESQGRSSVLSAMAEQSPDLAKEYNRDMLASKDREIARQQRNDIAKESLALRGEIARGNLGSDKELIKKTMGEMPKLKKDAISANTGITQINRTLDLVKQGVTGKGGQIKAFLAPYAEAMGINSKSLSEAQTFQLLTRAIIGPMRLEIVGPGPVSEWEQQLMQKISGGGGAAKEAATELLSHWRKLSQDKIENYNNTLEGFSEIYPNIKRVYQPIPTSNQTSSGQEWIENGIKYRINPATGKKQRWAE